MFAVSSIRHTNEENPSLLYVFFICRYCGIKEITGPNIIIRLKRIAKIPIEDETLRKAEMLNG